MKRLIFIILAALMLTGCSAEPAQKPTETVPETTEPAGYYTPDSLAEEQTAGAVRAYSLPDGECLGLASVDNRLLLVCADGTIVATTGETCVPELTVKVCAEQMENIVFSQTGDTVAYYCQKQNQVVLLDARLVEYSRIDMPEELSGKPCISLESGEVFYCQAQEVRALDMNSGISRLIFSHRHPEAGLEGCFLNGSLLALRVTDTEKNTAVLYLSAENGQILWQNDTAYDLRTWGEQYLLGRVDGGVQQWAVGTVKADPAGLYVTGTVFEFLQHNAVVSCNADNGCAVLDLYDLTTGRRTAGVTVPGVSNVVDIISHDRYIWILGKQDDVMTLYRWDTLMSPVADDAVYTGQFRTPENPDTEGLAESSKRARQLGDTYGIVVHIWKDAVENDGGHVLTPEHQTVVVNRALDELEVILSQFPKGFLSNTIRSGKLQVSLVRSIDDGTDSEQFYSDGDAYIILTTQSDVGEAFIRGLSYVVDSHVLGNSRDYDDWGALNPDDFSYAFTYDWEPDETSAVYLQEGSRYFTESLAMTYPHEDRSSLFVYAMLPDNEVFFAEDAMQEKLCCLCEGIREAYGLEDSEEKFPWEQYLTKELSYKNR